MADLEFNGRGSATKRREVDLGDGFFAEEVVVRTLQRALAVTPAQLTPLGYAQDTDLSAAGGLPLVSGSIPAATTVALIQAEGADVRWRDDGVDPTASVGFLLGAGTTFAYRGTFSAIKFIQASGGAKLNVSYYQEVAG